MQTIIITNIILCAIGFICIYLKIFKCKKQLWKSMRTTAIPGAILGFIISLSVFPQITVQNIIYFVTSGVLTSEIIYIFYLTVKSTCKYDNLAPYYDDGTPPKFYITGDKHRDYSKVKSFCQYMNTRKKDVLIILGDAGFNYYDDERDDRLKKEISNLNITLFCLHGNKENRVQNIATYGIKNFCGGKVYYEPQYPNIIFAIDGEIYIFEGKKYLVVGGAHSVDKIRCLEENKPFWEDEMPSNYIKSIVEKALHNNHFSIYGMLTHTCPIDYLPTEMFMSTRQKAMIKRKPHKAKSKKLFKPDIDRSTEEWLGRIERHLNYEVWFCGHYHVDKQIDKIVMLYQGIRPLHFQHIGSKS